MMTREIEIQTATEMFGHQNPKQPAAATRLAGQYGIQRRRQMTHSAAPNMVPA